MKRILICVTAVLTVVSMVSCKKKQEVVSPVLAPITEAVFASGHVEPVRQFMLNTLNDGYLNEKLVVEGQVVKTGQVLFVQDFTNPDIQREKTLENMKIARVNSEDTGSVMKQLYAQALTAKQKLLTDSLQLNRMKKLYLSRSVSKMDLDNAQFNYDNSFNSLLAANENILTERRNLQQALINSEKDYQSALNSRGYYNLVSPGDYRVYEIYKKEGELVRKGENVAMLGHPDSMLVVMNVDESSIAKIKLQQLVLVELNTEKGKTYRAWVSKIYPHFDDASQSYKVEAVFKDVPVNLIAGTLLQANTIIGKKEKAMLIPRPCLVSGNKVILIRSHSHDTVQVTTGIISTDWVEILGGLNITDKVLKAY